MNLVSRSHEADDGVWVGHEKALDRTTSATGKIFLDPVCRKAMQNIDGQSNRDDVANAVFPLKVGTPAVPLIENELSSAGVGYQNPDVHRRRMSRRSFLCQGMCQRCSRSCALENFRGQSASAEISWIKQARECRWTSCVLQCLERMLTSSLRWAPMERHLASWALIAVPTQPKGMLKQSGKYRWAYLR